MKNTLSALTLITTCLLSSTFHANAKEVELDRVAAVVNKGVVLESDVKSLIENIKSQSAKNNQSLPSDKALRTQVIDKLINTELILQVGERMGLQISDAELDQTLTNMAKENKLTLEQFRKTIIDSGLDYEVYRENIRNEIITGEVKRAGVGRRIYVSPQEINNLIGLMKEQTNNNIEYHLGHILIAFQGEPDQAQITSEKKRAEKVIELLNSGSDFTKIAIASSGDSTALDGGDMGWKGINEMPTLFSELVDGKEKGTVLGPIRTGLGFSIVKILDIRGREVVEVEEVKARHILIKPSVIMSEAKAEATLQGLLDKIAAGEADFAELAKEYSEGPTSVRGGDLGWADPKNYDPAFSDALAALKIDEYSKPFRSSFGWHIAQLTGRRTQDATDEMNTRKAHNIIYNRKFGMESARWMKETRDEAYIEILDRGNQ
ncbi:MULTISPECIES: peptidylprolyl isomerase SurA [Colwelliaceae]|mgnify:CR=1 FL=1|uniref:peptidylprolyl isomerase SurA n=1 Tax=Colwelliaceae TaxID=267889 RepID=UPI000970F2DD|nr:MULTISPECIES: peptidylprolyl isomerase SurA [Colwelliaceae]